MSYASARNRYNNAVSEISSHEYRLNDLRTQKQQTITLINELKVDIENHATAYISMNKIINESPNIHSRLNSSDNKIIDAATNYTDMANSYGVATKDLTTVFSGDSTGTRLALINIFDILRERNAIIKERGMELQAQLRQAETNLENIESAIGTNETNLQSWVSARRSASISMAHYRWLESQPPPPRR